MCREGLHYKSVLKCFCTLWLSKIKIISFVLCHREGKDLINHFRSRDLASDGVPNRHSCCSPYSDFPFPCIWNCYFLEDFRSTQQWPQHLNHHRPFEVEHSYRRQKEPSLQTHSGIGKASDKPVQAIVSTGIIMKASLTRSNRTVPFSILNGILEPYVRSQTFCNSGAISASFDIHGLSPETTRLIKLGMTTRLHASSDVAPAGRRSTAGCCFRVTPLDFTNG